MPNQDTMLRNVTPRVLLVALCALMAAAPAGAAAATKTKQPAGSAKSGGAKSGPSLEIKGGGYGHGIGMSQYGAMGYALHDWAYQAILAHYYQGTVLGGVANPDITVLLGQGAATFHGAGAANGHRLNPAKSYGVFVSGAKLTLMSAGRRAGSFSAPLRVTAAGGSHLGVAGKGEYAGALLFRPNGGRVMTINEVDLEDYVRGVIGEEMPASWPQQALDAQAVAARTYVLADPAVSSFYDVYSDTRSQVYGGLSAETAATNLAESQTRGKVVESGGKPVITYFFSSSGGHTESVQDVFLGVSTAPYLTGVPDPYDDSGHNPYYRWSDRLSLASAGLRLSGLYKGRFEGIKVLEHGTSPRIVSAQVLGSKGDSTVSGATLQSDLGTDSTWMSFTTVTAKGTTSSGDGVAAPAGAGAPAAGAPGEGAPAAGAPTGTVPATGAPTSTVPATGAPTSTVPPAPPSGGSGIGASR